MKIRFNTQTICKYTKNLRNNGRMRVKFDKWLLHIPRIIRGSPQMRKNEREICVLYIKYIVI